MKCSRRLQFFGLQPISMARPECVTWLFLRKICKQTNKKSDLCIYIGDLKNEDSVLEWLSDDENRELADEIEAVNSRMLERLLDESPFLAVFFCKYCVRNNSRHQHIVNLTRSLPAIHCPLPVPEP